MAFAKWPQQRDVSTSCHRANSYNRTGIPRLSKRVFLTDAMRGPMHCSCMTTTLTPRPGSPCHTLPVLSNGRLSGVLTLDNVGEFVMIEAALRSLSSHKKS